MGLAHQIAQDLRDRAAYRKREREKVDRQEYCEECQEYHDPPTWEPGQPCTHTH